MFVLALAVPVQARADNIFPWTQQPVARLPAGLERAPTGKLSLLTRTAPDGRVMFYVVNRTRKPVLFHTQDGFPYLMQEVRAPSGAWVRSQALEVWLCYVDWVDRTLAPGRFVELPEGTHRREFDPRAGESADVRYAAYRQGFNLTSAPFRGRYQRVEVELAKADWLAMMTFSFERALDVHEGRVKFANSVPECTPANVAYQRIEELAVEGDARAEAYLRETARSPDEGYARQARETLEALKQRRQRRRSTR